MSHKKRLFDQICDHFDNNRPKRVHWDPSYFTCPECRINPLTPCKTGVQCQACRLTIQLDCPDLTPNAMDRILQMVQTQHAPCEATRAGKATAQTLPDDNVYLTWTCPGCNQLEVLL